MSSPLKAIAVAVTVILAVLTCMQMIRPSRPCFQNTECKCRVYGDISLTRSDQEKGNFNDLPARLSRLNAVCERYNNTLFMEDSNDQRAYWNFPNHSRGACSLHLVTPLNFAFCPVPKAATSSLKALILQAEDTKDPGDNADEISSVFEKHPSVSPSAYWRKKLGRGYVKAIIVRHPFERLVSAYVDRVRTTRPSIEGAIRLYRNGFTGNGPNGTLTFGEFVTSILKDPVETWDVHWAPHTPRCRPCSIRYDVVVKVETLDSDFEHLLPRLGLSGWKLPKRNAKSPREKSDALKTFARHFSELTRQQVLQLFAIYVYDFELYDYKLEGYTGAVF